MIGQTLELIRKEVNDYIDTKLGGTAAENRVVLTSFVDETGNIAIPSDTVGLSLLNIEEEKILKTARLTPLQYSEQNTQLANPPINLNLQLMFATNFTNYEESLKHISFIISCFQTRPVFDVDNTPSIQFLETKKLVFELNTLGLEQQHYIWSMIGLRYMPSIIFKVKMLSIDEQDVAHEVPNIKSIGTDPNIKDTND